MSDASTILQLSDLIEMHTLQELQERFSSLGRISMRLVGMEGEAITQPSCSSDVCRMLHNVSEGRLACHKSATHFMGDGDGTPIPPVVGECYAGMQLFQAPIVVAGEVLAHLVVGDRPKHTITPAEVDTLATDYALSRSKLEKAIFALPPWSTERDAALQQFMQLFADMISGLAQQRLELRDRLTELSTLYEITELFSGTDRLQVILEVIARRVGEVLRVKGCSIRLLDKDTGELVVRAVYNLSQQYLRKGPVKLGESPIDTAAFAGATVYIEDAGTDPRIRYPAEAKREGIVSGLCVPMTYRGRTVGVLRVYADRKMRFTSYEEDLARAVGSQSAAAIVNAQFISERRASEQYQQQMRMAGEIQRRMIPSQPPPHSRISFATAYEPTLDVGGDFFDFLELPKGNLGLCIADVVGKGIPASLMMASVRSALRAHAEAIYHIDHIVSRVNRHLCRDKLMSEFATLFYGVFSSDGTRFTYCNAGHDPPLLHRNGQLRALSAGGTVLGLRPDATFERDLIELHPSDVIVFYTDGIVDAMNYDRQRFGRHRLEESIQRYSGGDAPLIAHQILWDVRRFVGLARQNDDISMVVAKVH